MKKKKKKRVFLSFSAIPPTWGSPASNLPISGAFITQKRERNGVKMKDESAPEGLTCWDPHPCPARAPPAAALWCRRWSSPSARPGSAPLQRERGKNNIKIGKNQRFWGWKSAPRAQTFLSPERPPRSRVSPSAASTGVLNPSRVPGQPFRWRNSF